MPRPRLRTEGLRAHLLDTAIDVLAEGGPTAVTTRNVAARAGTTAPAIYELFGDKAGMIRAVFFEGFRRLGEDLAALPAPSGSTDDIAAAVRTFRLFARRHPHLFDVMYGQPFESFSPDNDERRLGDSTRTSITARVQACLDAGSLHGDALDIAHAIIGLAIGLASQEVGDWLGSSGASRDRRWNVAVTALLRGLGSPNDGSQR